MIGVGTAAKNRRLDFRRFCSIFAHGRGFLNLFATSSSLAHIKSHFSTDKMADKRAEISWLERRIHNPEVVGS